MAVTRSRSRIVIERATGSVVTGFVASKMGCRYWRCGLGPTRRIRVRHTLGPPDLRYREFADVKRAIAFSLTFVEHIQIG